MCPGYIAPRLLEDLICVQGISQPDGITYKSVFLIVRKIAPFRAKIKGKKGNEVKYLL